MIPSRRCSGAVSRCLSRGISVSIPSRRTTACAARQTARPSSSAERRICCARILTPATGRPRCACCSRARFSTTAAPTGMSARRSRWTPVRIFMRTMPSRPRPGRCLGTGYSTFWSRRARITFSAAAFRAICRCCASCAMRSSKRPSQAARSRRCFVNWRPLRSRVSHAGIRRSLPSGRRWKRPFSRHRPPRARTSAAASLRRSRLSWRACAASRTPMRLHASHRSSWTMHLVRLTVPSFSATAVTAASACAARRRTRHAAARLPTGRTQTSTKATARPAAAATTPSATAT